MIISDLEHLEVVREEEEERVEGGFANADATANAFAFGSTLAATYTFTDTNAFSESFIISSGF